MASERLELTPRADPYGNEEREVGNKDVELRGHGNQAPPAEASNRERLDVRLLKYIRPSNIAA